MSQGTKHQAFEALKIPSFPVFVATFVLTMMADNVEHVISYWVAFENLSLRPWWFRGDFTLVAVFALLCWCRCTQR